MTVGRCISTETFNSTVLHNICVHQFYTTVKILHTKLHNLRMVPGFYSQCRCRIQSSSRGSGRWFWGSADLRAELTVGRYAPTCTASLPSCQSYFALPFLPWHASARELLQTASTSAFKAHKCDSGQHP